MNQEKNIVSKMITPPNVPIKKQYNVPALSKSIAILDLLAESEDALPLSFIHQELSIPKATAYMILQVMESNNMVSKTSDDKYTLGFKLYSLGMSYMARMDLQKIAHPYMNLLSEETGFVVHLGRIVENQVIYIGKVEPTSFIRFNTYIGLRSDIHNCSLGKVIAAFMDEKQVDSIFESTGLSRYTTNTITDPDKLKKALKRIRETGYAIEDEEGEMGVRCIGAAIFDKDGNVVGAISITALKSDLTTDMFPYVGNQVKNAAKAISNALGHTIHDRK